MQHNDYLASKPRYEILDGLRGVASMMVVAYHLFETYSHDPMHQILIMAIWLSISSLFSPDLLSVMLMTTAGIE